MNTIVLHFFIMFIMLIGLFFTFMPKLPGNFIIFSVILFYGAITDFISFNLITIVTFSLLMLCGEVGTRWLRRKLTRKLVISPNFAANATAGNAAGMVASEAFMGSAGWWVWQLIAGKNLFPRFDTIGQAFVKTGIAAAIRILCGLMMIIFFYAFIAI